MKRELARFGSVTSSSLIESLRVRTVFGGCGLTRGMRIAARPLLFPWLAGEFTDAARRSQFYWTRQQSTPRDSCTGVQIRLTRTGGLGTIPRETSRWKRSRSIRSG